MKNLYLIRHAKAEDHSFTKRDFDRNITKDGIIRAQQIAASLSKQLNTTSTEKTLVISSTANRAYQTAEIFCKAIGYPIDRIKKEETIYEAYYKDILKVINEVTDDIDIVLVFGHNPGLSDLTNYLCNSIIDLKTSHAALVQLPENFDFADIAGGTADLTTVLTT